MNCEHYNRGCDLLAPCCNEFFPCRFCHDQQHYEEERDVLKQHKMNRFLVETMRCRHCKHIQAISKQCQNCQTILGSYYCSICKLHDSDELKQIYHCEKCGICRVGPESDYFHCEVCDACLHVYMKDIHTCRPNALQTCCSICQEDLFTSRLPSCPLKCGHYMHRKCFKSMLKSNHYKCPLCAKTVVNLGDYYKAIDEQIETSPMPEEYRGKVVKIYCNDCSLEAEAEFHFLGLKCSGCGSYNTARA